jgi:alkylation response protein AidB-like acyl-CoA dehydrogenase
VDHVGPRRRLLLSAGPRRSHNSGVLNAGGQVGVEANASKVLWSERYQAVARLGLDVALAGLGPSVAAWSGEYYASLATSIYAGTNQVQRTIVAERALRLP